MTPWEYRWTTVYPQNRSSTSLETLNSLGEEGWEVVAVIPASGRQHAVLLKRPRPEKPAEP